jgi:hypothetical protein
MKKKNERLFRAVSVGPRGSFRRLASYLQATVGLVCTLLAGTAQAQAPTRTDPVRVFLDCEFCDLNYLQVETPWVAFVRDRTAGDVHLLLTRIETGGGGQRYDLEVLPAANPSRRDTLIFQTPPNATEDARRAEIARNIQLALVPYALRTEAGRSLRLAPVKRDEDDEDRPRTGRDPWKAWVFEVSGGSSLQKEQRQSEAQFEGSLEGRRVTSLLKLGFEANAEFQRSRFDLDDEDSTITSTFENYDGGAVIVHSIARKWGLGAEVSASSSTFRNTRFAIRAAPAIEYSLWPYEVATRRQLVFQYSVGISSFKYREETIFDKISEVRPNHTFVIGYDVRQPWGSANASLEAAAYLDDMQQNRIELDAEWNLRLFRGMELEFGGSIERIRDQLSIPKRDATPEEILLERRALATDYRYDVRIGFSYTFGSIFSPVVNPRFGSGPGSILR